MPWTDLIEIKIILERFRMTILRFQGQKSLDLDIVSKSARVWRSGKGAKCLSLGPSPACKPKLQQAGAYYLVNW